MNIFILEFQNTVVESTLKQFIVNDSRYAYNI